MSDDLTELRVEVQALRDDELRVAARLGMGTDRASDAMSKSFAFDTVLDLIDKAQRAGQAQGGAVTDLGILIERMRQEDHRRVDRMSDIASYRAKVYRIPRDPRGEPPNNHDGEHNPWCASVPWWPNDPHLRTTDGFHRTYCCCREGAMRMTDGSLLRDRTRLREWATHYGYQPVLEHLDSR